MNRVSGTIHIAPGKTINMHGQLVHDVRGLKQIPHRTDHIVHHLSFGDEFPGQINPLDNTNVRLTQSIEYKYHNIIFSTQAKIQI